MSPKTIAVVGVTGQQGGAVATHFHTLGWKVRGLTRSPSSTKAVALAARLPGIQIVQADAEDTASLKAAFRGAHVVYAMTDYWASYFGHPPELDAVKDDGRAVGEWAAAVEIRQGKNLADAAAQVLAEDGVLERYIWSTLPPVSKESGGKYTYSFYFDAKDVIKQYILAQQPALAAKASFLVLAIYTNIIALTAQMLGGVQFDPEGRVIQPTLSGVDAQHHFVDITDTGKFVEALVNAPPGKSLLGFDEEMSFADLASVMSAVTGVPVVALPVTIEQLEASGGGLGKMMGNTASFSAEFAYGAANLLAPKDVDPNIKLVTVKGALKKENWTPFVDLVKKSREALQAAASK
ncbi:hypothetical protein NKR23_g7733 [Pleurostoma richardsiae]|uniref:NmrA-like domain-containing protein n=1 Tax=Pleurostoma richardsiae TaxID=41990 RepID=A0AA38RKP8_9PEZI|nr:hypothetical protein NKR23_g7733 [Pleurostoma richardsiae]